MSVRPATEMRPADAEGRRFVAERTVRLGDVDVDGRIRLDAVARHLQDVAGDDAIAAGLSNAMGWVVRRTMIRVDACPVLNERIVLTTFCSGAGRSWAERRTSISGADGGAVEAVSLWVQVDVTSGRPARLGDEFFDVYGRAAGDRTVSSKLSLPPPPDDARRSPWAFRRADLDPFAHVNNAAHWVVAEEFLVGPRRVGTHEIEYVAPVDTDAVEVAVVDGHAWLLAGERVLSAIRSSPSGGL